MTGKGGSHLHCELARLTEQDRRIVQCVVAGSTNRQAAEELHLSPKTVENRLTAIYATLGLRNRVDLARHLALDGSAPRTSDGQTMIGRRPSTSRSP